MQHRGEWLQCHSGRRFYPQDPQPEDIDIEDIAHALSRICRFGGHVADDPYSVAQHSVLVSDVVASRSEDKTVAATAELAMWGLLHDASEAYLGDVVWPLKQASELTGYKLLEVKTMNAIVKRFRLSPEEPPVVKAADIALLATEKRDIVCLGGVVTKESEAARARTGEWHSDHVAPLPSRIVPWAPNAAKREFLRRFSEWSAVRCAERDS